MRAPYLSVQAHPGTIVILYCELLVNSGDLQPRKVTHELTYVSFY